jgi:peptide/nickel transport system permease protein
MFLLGTDELGRDRWSRLLHGTRVSLFCALVSAFIATAIATTVGIAAGYFGGWLDGTATIVIDLFLSIPWLFALLTLRALLPLNISPWASLTLLFVLLAAVGWASGARVIRASAAGVRNSQPILHARA